MPCPGGASVAFIVLSRWCHTVSRTIPYGICVKAPGFLSGDE